MHKDSVDEYILESFIIDSEDMIFFKSAHKYFFLTIGLRPKLNIKLEREISKRISPVNWVFGHQCLVQSSE